LSWNFAALNSVSDLQKFFAELTRITRKVIFVCIPNENNVCWLIRSEFDAPGPSKEKSIKLMRLPEIMAKFEWKMLEQGYLDVPPWPDIAMKKEDLLKKLGLCWLANVLEGKKKGDFSILNYFNGKDPDMEKRVLRWSFLEDAPKIFKKLWAHHRYFVFVPR
jgi:hypothetical protein